VGSLFEEILEAIRAEEGPVTVKALAAKLEIEEGALEKMLEFLERKGRLSMYRPADEKGCGLVSCTGCIFAHGCPAAKKGGA